VTKIDQERPAPAVERSDSSSDHQPEAKSDFQIGGPASVTPDDMEHAPELPPGDIRHRSFYGRWGF